YDQGVNYFDNADVYEDGVAETYMGQAIKDLPREALVISSKVFWPTMPGPNGR
ncbi:MAG: aldo/keto reductase, partial [Gammaproteobacteria bacterium]|nr:aldo/keto reductase [Gammaproteobacteria bacterium]